MDTYFSTSAPTPMSTSMKLLHFERITFDNSVEITSKELQIVPWCQKTFYADKDLSLCTISINIPYVGNLYTDAHMQSKIVLFLDDEPIYTGQFNSHTVNLFRPVFITADKPYLKAGQHKIILKACVNRGNLNIPHVNKECIEYKIEPKNFATIKIMGFF